VHWLALSPNPISTLVTAQFGLRKLSDATEVDLSAFEVGAWFCILRRLNYLLGKLKPEEKKTGGMIWQHH
jgi:hypothetical protein